MQINQRHREWLSKVLFEAFLIMLSILSALALNNWNQERAEAQQVKRSLEAMYLEISQSRKWVEEQIPFHTGIVEVLNALNDSDEEFNRNDFRSLLDGLAPFVLRDSAWETTVGTGILHSMDFELVAAISHTYKTQKRFEQQFSRGVATLREKTFDESISLHELYYFAGHFFSRMTQTENQMLIIMSETQQRIAPYLTKAN